MHQYADDSRYQMKTGYVSRLLEFDPNRVCPIAVHLFASATGDAS